MFKTFLVLLLLASAHFTFSDEIQKVDPLEDINRVFYELNFNLLDPVIIKPIAIIYDQATPKPVRQVLRNFFSNLDEVPSLVNNTLQGKFGQAGNNAGRFLMNTTIGLGGFFDVAKKAGLQPGEDEDFGQTLAVWGVPAGPYVMLPFFGPSTFRDAPSNFVDSLFDPFSYNNRLPVRVAIKGIDLIALRADLLGIDDVISGDEYLFIRDVYLQNREYVISDGAIEDDFDDLDDY
ncbi:VacJ family lipoprotein [Porticoccaceae bacterium]|jgi:phospholipid-binding lipoprotein MlaA|nr:VacJ family lipoprotein [Porticoccaceae bacterium]|tara:strand:+ start:1285 stop:1986 length:702 start_codon:yes stop_codon:yes gene_type:complete